MLDDQHFGSAVINTRSVEQRSRNDAPGFEDGDRTVKRTKVLPRIAGQHHKVRNLAWSDGPCRIAHAKRVRGKASRRGEDHLARQPGTQEQFHLVNLSRSRLKPRIADL